jgi:hypothetical protein
MISFTNKKLELNGVMLDMPYEIHDAFEYDDHVIVLFKPGASKDRSKSFPNLRSYDQQGREVWSAGLPTSEHMDRYYKISSREPLVVHSVCSYTCEIDPDTGKIIKRTFYK